MSSDLGVCRLLRSTSLSLNESAFLDQVIPSTLSTVNRITYGYISPIIIIVGIIGDVLTVCTLTHPLLRRSSIIYTYLTLLAMTDFLTQLSLIPMVLYLVDTRICHPLAAFYYAHVGFPLANALMGSSVYIVVFLTLSQYMAVCRPFTYGMRSRKICFILFAVAYIFNFCIYAPWALKKGWHELPQEYHRPHICPYVVCDVANLNKSAFQAYEAVREIACRVLPFFVVAYLNANILITYRNTKLDRIQRLTNSQKRFVTEKSEKEEKRLFIFLFGICIVFFVCTIPAAPLTILVAEENTLSLPFQIFRAVVNVLEFTKFALNFYFYCLINPEIRSICHHVITCKKMHRPARVKGQPMTPISMYTKSTKSRDVVVNGVGSRRSSSNHDGRSSNKNSLKNVQKRSLEYPTVHMNGRERADTVVQADLLAHKLTVIKENETEDIGDRI